MGVWQAVRMGAPPRCNLQFRLYTVFQLFANYGHGGAAHPRGRRRSSRGLHAALLLTVGAMLLMVPRSSMAQVVENLPAPVVVDTAGPSPRGAFLRSLVLPGWGQAYVGSPGRGAAYFALEAGSLWMLYRTRERLLDARDREAFLRSTGALGPDQDARLVLAREAQQEDWLTLAIFLAFFSGADAYVGALLSDFDEHVGVLPTPGGGLQLRANIPLGPRR